MYPILQEDMSPTFLCLRKLLGTNEWNTDHKLWYAMNQSWKLQQQFHQGDISLWPFVVWAEAAKRHQKKCFASQSANPNNTDFWKNCMANRVFLKKAESHAQQDVWTTIQKICSGRDYLYYLWYTIPENTTSCQKPHHARIPTQSITFPNVLQGLDLGSSIWLKRSAIRPVMFGCLGASGWIDQIAIPKT